jgi:hypothetical protein
MTRITKIKRRTGIRTAHLGRYLAREDIGDMSNRPVTVEQGDSPPRWEGEGSYYETRTGIRIHHPSAYSKVGWSSMVYCCSTLTIVVGSRWLAQQAAVLVRKPPHGTMACLVGWAS